MIKTSGEEDMLFILLLCLWDKVRDWHNSLLSRTYQKLWLFTQAWIWELWLEPQLGRDEAWEKANWLRGLSTRSLYNTVMATCRDPHSNTLLGNIPDYYCHFMACFFMGVVPISPPYIDMLQPGNKRLGLSIGGGEGGHKLRWLQWFWSWWEVCCLSLSISR